MTAETLLELAARVEAASGADRELDLLVHQTRDADFAAIEPAAFGFFVKYGAQPAYTASLDAAMTLVPEGWQGDDLSWWAGCGANCELVETRLEDGDWVRGEFARGRVEAHAATPALALTAACLRARAASVDTHAKRGDPVQQGAPSPMGGAVPAQQGDAQ